MDGKIYIYGFDDFICSNCMGSFVAVCLGTIYTYTQTDPLVESVDFNEYVYFQLERKYKLKFETWPVGGRYLCAGTQAGLNWN